MFRLTHAQKKCIVPVLFIVISVGLLIRLKGSPHYLLEDKGNKAKEVKKDFRVKVSLDHAKTISTSSPEKASFQSWFDPDYLMRKTVTELMKNGWSPPEGGIAGYVMGLKKAGMIPKSVAGQLSKPVGKLLVTAERWKVESVGCFYHRAPKLSLYDVIPLSGISVDSVDGCIKQCYEKGKMYAALSKGNFCSCGKTIHKPSLLTLVAQTLCNMKCRDGHYCGGEKYANVYRIAKHSMDSITSSDISMLSAGCYEEPPDMNVVFPHTATMSSGNSAKCLIYCEKENFVMASWKKSGECKCGRFDSKFPLSQMKTQVNDYLCDNSTCQGDEEKCRKDYVRIFRTYAQDERCEIKRFLPTPRTPLTALISFPGSGNTWVRYLIESATGIYSGSVYHDGGLFTNGFTGELLDWNSHRTSVIKTHLSTDESVSLYDEAILIIRNPYDAILAEFNRVSGGHVGYADQKLFKTQEWIYFFAYKMPKWFAVATNFAKMDKLLVIYFEDIVSNPIREVRKMVEFLNLPIADVEERLACVETNLSGSFKRPKRTLPFDPFSKRITEIVNPYVKKAREIYASRNLPLIPEYEK